VLIQQFCEQELVEEKAIGLGREQQNILYTASTTFKHTFFKYLLIIDYFTET
jgi:hypothetical protein